MNTVLLTFQGTNIKATGMIKYGSIYKHKYEMVGWCSKNSSGIVDDGKITGFHAI